VSIELEILIRNIVWLLLRPRVRWHEPSTRAPGRADCARRGCAAGGRYRAMALDDVSPRREVLTWAASTASDAARSSRWARSCARHSPIGCCDDETFAHFARREAPAMQLHNEL